MLRNHHKKSFQVLANIRDHGRGQVAVDLLWLDQIEQGISLSHPVKTPDHQQGAQGRQHLAVMEVKVAANPGSNPGQATVIHLVPSIGLVAMGAEHITAADAAAVARAVINKDDPGRQQPGFCQPVQQCLLHGCERQFQVMVAHQDDQGIVLMADKPGQGVKDRL